MIEQIKQKLEDSMQHSLQHMGKELDKIRTGRLTPELFFNLRVDLYGSMTPLQQLCKFHTEESKTLVIVPFDKKNIGAIDKAIQETMKGFNPVVTGEQIRVLAPPLTSARRMELVKEVKAISEKSKVSIRDIRREANTKIKKMAKNKEISEDEQRRAEDMFQKSTDSSIAKIEEFVKLKSEELTKI